MRPPPKTTLFPYTTLFRSGAVGTEALVRHHAIVRDVAEGGGGRVFERIGDAAYCVFGDPADAVEAAAAIRRQDRKSTRLNSSHSQISYAVFCLKKNNKHTH